LPSKKGPPGKEGPRGRAGERPAHEIITRRDVLAREIAKGTSTNTAGRKRFGKGGASLWGGPEDAGEKGGPGNNWAAKVCLGKGRGPWSGGEKKVRKGDFSDGPWQNRGAAGGHLGEKAGLSKRVLGGGGRGVGGVSCRGIEKKKKKTGAREGKKKGVGKKGASAHAGKSQQRRDRHPWRKRGEKGGEKKKGALIKRGQARCWKPWPF